MPSSLKLFFKSGNLFYAKWIHFHERLRKRMIDSSKCWKSKTDIGELTISCSRRRSLPTTSWSFVIWICIYYISYIEARQGWKFYYIYVPPPLQSETHGFTLCNNRRALAIAQHFNLSHVYIVPHIFACWPDMIVSNWWLNGPLIFVIDFRKSFSSFSSSGNSSLGSKQHIIKGDESAYFVAIRFPDFKNTPMVLFFYFFLLFFISFEFSAIGLILRARETCCTPYRTHTLAIRYIPSTYMLLNI